MSSNIYRNAEGYTDKTAGSAIERGDKVPENVVQFRRGVKLLCEICHVRILDKIHVIDEKGRKW